MDGHEYWCDEARAVYHYKVNKNLTIFGHLFTTENHKLQFKSLYNT